MLFIFRAADEEETPLVQDNTLCLALLAFSFKLPQVQFKRISGEYYYVMYTDSIGGGDDGSVAVVVGAVIGGLVAVTIIIVVVLVVVLLVYRYGMCSVV